MGEGKGGRGGGGRKVEEKDKEGEEEGVGGGGGPPKVMWAKEERTLRSEMPGGGNVIGSSRQSGDAYGE